MLEKLIEIGKRLLSESDISRVLTVAIDGAIEMTGAERGMILLFEDGDKISFEAARNLKKEDIENPKFEISRTIISRVKTDCQPIYLHNALEDPAFKKSASAARLKILSVICLPLCHRDEVFGVVYLDNRTVLGAFEPETCQFAESFADFVSLAAYHALERRQMQSRQHALEKELHPRYDFKAIVGYSSKILEVLEVVSQVAETDAPVLIEGESGTGKELVARALHYNSHRRELPMVSINCGAIPDNLLESELFGHEKGAFTGAFKRHKGKFELADGGTIFLDEVDEMSPALQVKLLRILQGGEFSPLGSEESKRCDVRLVAAAKDSLLKLVQQGTFRDDLYYRLNLIRIEMPTLRQRKEDILLLANYFLQDACKSLSKAVPTLSAHVQTVLQHYDYPGNVRELENIIERAAILCKGESIEIEHLPPELQPTRTGDLKGDPASVQTFQEAKQQAIEDFERRYIERVLQECEGVICKAAERAGMHEKNFHTKLAKYGLRPEKPESKN